MKTSKFCMTAHRLVWRARARALGGIIDFNGNSRSREQGNGCVQRGFLGNPSNQ